MALRKVGSLRFLTWFLVFVIKKGAQGFQTSHLRPFQDRLLEELNPIDNRSISKSRHRHF